MKELDFFSSIFGFTYQKSVRYQTNFGSLLSILFVSLYIFVLLNSGAEFFDKEKNISFSTGEIKYSSPPKINFKNYKNYSFIFRLIIDGQITDPDDFKEEFEIKFYYKTIMYTNNTSYKKEIKFESCTNVNLLPSKLCINLNSLENPISGWEGPINSVNLIYNTKNSQTDNLINTFDKKNIKLIPDDFSYYYTEFKYNTSSSNAIKLLKYHSVQAQLIFTDISYDPFNYEFPLKQIFNVYNTELRVSNKKSINLLYEYSNFTSEDYNIIFYSYTRDYYLLQVSLSDERSYFYEDDFINSDFINISNKNTNITDILKTDEESLLNNNGILGKFYIRSGNKGHYISRKFPKLSTIFSNISGVMTLLYYIFSLIVFIYSKTSFFTKLTKDSIFLIKNTDLVRNLVEIKKEGNLSRSRSLDNWNIGSPKSNDVIPQPKHSTKNIRIRVVDSDNRLSNIELGRTKSETNTKQNINLQENKVEAPPRNDSSSLSSSSSSENIFSPQEHGKKESVILNKTEMKDYNDYSEEIEEVPELNKNFKESRKFSEDDDIKPNKIQSDNTQDVLINKIQMINNFPNISINMDPESNPYNNLSNNFMNNISLKANKNHLNLEFQSEGKYLKQISTNRNFQTSRILSNNPLQTSQIKNNNLKRYSFLANNKDGNANKNDLNNSKYFNLSKYLLNSQKSIRSNCKNNNRMRSMLYPIKKSTSGFSKNHIYTKLDESNEDINSFHILRFVKFDLNSSFSAICCISFFPCLRRCNKKIKHQGQIYDFSKNYFEKYLDFNNFMQKFIEVDLIKHFIFDKDQLSLIKQLKHIIILDKNNENLDYRGVNDSIIHQYQSGEREGVKSTKFNVISNKLQRFYLQLSQRKDRNLIEENLYNYLHKLSSPYEI